MPFLRTPLASALAVALTLATWPATAQEPLTPQQKCMARRAAELDAYRKLAETVHGIEIKSQTSVKDFVTENDTIQAGFQTFIRGLRIVGDAVFNPDGTCEVQAAVTVSQVVRELKRLHRESYGGTAVSPEDLETIATRTEQKVITATGYGAPPAPEKVAADPDFTGKNEPPPAEEPAREPDRPRWIYVASPAAGIPAWEGVTGAGRMMAVRAARLDAMRKLTETVEGLRLSSNTTVKDFVTQSDEIKAEVAGFIQGVKTLEEPKYNADGTVQVTLAVTLAQVVQQVKRIVERHYRGNSYEDIEYKKISTFTKKTVLDATGFGAPEERHKIPGGRFIGWEAFTGPNARVKLAAYQGARTDAQRKFSERTAGLEILSGTYVRDMVAESDVIKSRVRDHLVGTKDVGDIVFYSDGAVEARIGATWSQIVKQVQIAMPSGLSDAQLVEQIRIFEKQHFFFETGQGAVPPIPQFYSGQALPPNPPPVAPDAPPPWYARKVQATGYGALRADTPPPQAKLLAQRAARMDAFRKLSEQIMGIKIRGETTVRDFVTESDTIESSTEAFIRGATELAVKENPDGTWEVTLEVDLAELNTLIAPHLR